MRLGYGGLIPVYEGQFDAYYGSPGCSNHVNETCIRKHHFHWCTAHEQFTDENGFCSKTLSKEAARNIMRCSMIQCGLCNPSPDINSVICYSNCDQQTKSRWKHIGRKLKNTHSQGEQDSETRENLMSISMIRRSWNGPRGSLEVGKEEGRKGGQLVVQNWSRCKDLELELGWDLIVPGFWEDGIKESRLPGRILSIINVRMGSVNVDSTLAHCRMLDRSFF